MRNEKPNVSDPIGPLPHWSNDAGNDTLTGGAGMDNLYGGMGNDTYLLAAGDGGAGPLGEVEAIEDIGGLDTLRLDGIAPAQLNAFAANGDWLVIDYGAADRVAIINGMGGAIERIVVGGQTLSYAQFVGRYAATAQKGVNALSRESRRWRDGEINNICFAAHPCAANQGEFTWPA